MLYLGTTGGEEAPAGGMGFLIPMIAILILFFWLTHRSQKKKEQERQEMLDSIKVGDDIVTIGGIHGRVTRINDETLEVRINAEKDIKVKFSRASVSSVKENEEN